MHSFYRDPARRPMVMSSGAVACLAAPEMPCRKGRRSAASESCRLRRDEDARPHIARNSGLFTFWRRAGAHLRFSRKFWFRLAGSRPPGRVSLGMESRPRTGPFARGSRSAAGRRIETSLRRKRVRGGGSRRARAVRQGPTHLTPARERVASSADLSAPRMAPLGAETPAKHVNATASCR